MRRMQPLKNLRIVRNPIKLFMALAALYLVLSFVMPPNHATQKLYDLNAIQYHILIFLVMVPVLGIWFLAFYGYAKLQEYSSMIAKSAEGPSYKKIADGIMWLAWGLVIPTFLSLLLTGITNDHEGFHKAQVIISNYASIIFPVIAFSVLSTGTRQLMERAKIFITSGRTKLLVISFVFLGGLYCYLIFRNLDSLAARSNNNPYFLPGGLLLFTMVMPYLYAWFVGLLAAYELRLLSKSAPGILYQKAVDLLSRGLAVVVMSSIALQYLSTVLPATGKLSLGYILLLVYVLLAVIGIGYALTALGAKRLKKLEEV
jgi:hypothetical protein